MPLSVSHSETVLLAFRRLTQWQRILAWAAILFSTGARSTSVLESCFRRLEASQSADALTGMPFQFHRDWREGHAAPPGQFSVRFDFDQILGRAECAVTATARTGCPSNWAPLS